MKRLILASLCVLLFLVSPARAYLVEVYTEPNEIQDDWSLDGTVHELGNKTPFETEEWIESCEVAWDGNIPCPSEFVTSGARVRIANMTNKDWPRLYYVADPETSLTNWDELVGQVVMVDGLDHQEKAFLIDWSGENRPLVYESMTQDAIFEAGEVWDFVIQDYSNSEGVGPAAFGTLGIASSSSGDTDSSGSIITPEPATIGLLGFGSLLLSRSRKFNKK